MGALGGNDNILAGHREYRGIAPNGDSRTDDRHYQLPDERGNIIIRKHFGILHLMSSIERDQNRRPVTAGVNLANLATPIPFNMDPVTLRLLIDITFSSNAASIIPSHDKHDENHRTTAYGVTDDSNMTPKPFMVDHTNNFLFVDITFT